MRNLGYCEGWDRNCERILCSLMENTYRHTTYISKRCLIFDVDRYKDKYKNNCFSSGFVRARGRNDIRDVNINSENWAMVKAALLTGTYPKLAHINQESGSISSSGQTQISFHLTSVLSQPHYKKVRADVASH